MYNSNSGNFESAFEVGVNQESGYELSPEFEFNNESNMEYSNEYSNEYAGETGYELSPEFETGGAQNENFEVQLSNELMEVSNEYEFGAWLKRLAQKGAGAALGYLNSAGGQQLVSSLGNIAQKTISGFGQRAGNWLGQKIGGPIGNQISQYGAQAGQAVADRVPSFIRFASDTLKNVANEINMGQEPQVRPAIVRSAARHYPIILKVKGTIYARPMRNPNYYRPSNEFSNEYSNEFQGEANNESVLSEINEMELASELLSVKNDQELDMFLGSLFKKVTGAVSNFAKSGLGQTLGGILKTVASKALPVLGGIVGSAIPIPGVGTMIGSALGNAAGKMFGLELEGLSGEDREFETARAFVRLAADATKRAQYMRNMAPGQAARLAIIRSARTYAPGLIRLRRRPNYYRGSRPSYINYNPGYVYPPPPPPPVYGAYGNGAGFDNGTDPGYSPNTADTDVNPPNMDMNAGGDMNPETGMYEGNW